MINPSPLPKQYSPNPQINQVIFELLSLGISPIPVAPKQDSRKDWCHRVATNNEDAEYCPLDKNLNPIPRFTGKNPSYLSRTGQAFILEHGKYKEKLPTEEELKKWFCNPNTGIGAMCGMGAVIWIDFDTKTFDSQDECNQAVSKFLSKNNLTDNWIERTGSGGWRIPVVTEEKPSFTNFALELGGKHRGEALGYGRFTVLSPSIHPNGKTYSRVSRGGIAKVKSLEAIGIFPAKEEIKQSERKQHREQAQNSGLSLSKDFDDSLDIRNFAKYFDGYHERGNGWGYAQCPHHPNATSLTSFRVNLNTGAFKAWCCCGTGDVWKSGLELAKSRGYAPQTRIKGWTPPGDYIYKKNQKEVSSLEARLRRDSSHFEGQISEYEVKRRLRAKFNFTRKPNVKATDGFLPHIDLSSIPHGLIGIKGDWGIGKTFLLSKWCKEWEGKIIQVAHLNALLHNTAAKLDLMHHHELKDMQLGVTSFGRVAITDISLGAMLDPEKWCKGEPFILILDEIEQVFKSIQTNSNLRGTLRVKARCKLEWLVKNATYVIASDRDLCNETLDYLEQVRGDEKKAFIIHHSGRKGESRKPIKVNVTNKKDDQLSQLIADAKAGKKIVVPCENKKDLLAIELQLKESGIPEESMFFAHGDNSNEDGIKQVIEVIDQKYTDYQILAYTQTLGTAISLEKPHFDVCYAFFTGDVLSAGDQAQSLFRYRIDCEINIWVSSKKQTLEIDPDNLLNNLISKIDDTNQLIVSIDEIGELLEQGILPNARGEINEQDLPWIKHKLGIIARTNASRANPSQSLIDLLEQAGFTLVLGENLAEKTPEGENHKEFKKQVDKTKDKLTSESEPMNEVEFQQAILNPGSLKQSERYRFKKTKLQRDTGLEITQEIVELDRKKNLVRGARLLRLMNVDDRQAVAFDLIDRENNPDQADQHFYSPTRKLLHDLGVPELIEKLSTGIEYTSESEEVAKVCDRLRSSKTRVKKYLGFTPSTEKNKSGNFKESNTTALGKLLDALCLKSDVRKSGENRFYRLNAERWEMLKGITDHMEGKAKTPTLESIIETAINQATTSLEVWTPVSDSSIYINNQEVSTIPTLAEVKLAEVSQAIAPTEVMAIEQAIASSEFSPEEQAPVWAGLILKIKQGLEVTGFVLGNLYQDLVQRFGELEGIAEDEPLFNEYQQAWQVPVMFSDCTRSIPCDWVEVVYG
ncbi:plasmid replication protein, CyRepA1 family [Nostoc sp. FACHB-190]|uniref:plasmid replication protein, CyRepA1 family n=1 Tax=Nostoc sp. FACHB-190 TaxID=2692838 RepID=UPI00168767BC|nr:plasmid replication protein, CyRepA1 family [Nostoc sp. FACHB-190]MBD2303615.1 bifunctional DNA primase/polymerase [Nostoc sp. FACHB-190]